MSDTLRRAWATIDLSALKKNLAQVRAHCPDSRIIPVIKANAYGHGVEAVARALAVAPVKPAGFAVARLDEALALDAMGLGLPILLLSGFLNADELKQCLAAGIEPVIHNSQQLALIEEALESGEVTGKRRLWIKVNTGMHRLGFAAEDTPAIFARLQHYPDMELVLMSHLCCADDPQQQLHTDRQLARFGEVRQAVAGMQAGPVLASLAASSGILGHPDTHFDIVRPGIMLYGSSPLADQSSEDLGLLPVMTLRARLIAINTVKAGESIGYGASYTCPRDTTVGVVSVGYADGYPRSAVTGTPVLVKPGGQAIRASLIGRVSMDMITIDLSGIDAHLGDEVVLWGEGLPADEVAEYAGTIAYELFCRVTQRVSFDYAS